MNIIYIAGNDRSGSTLVERYINERTNYVCLGEVKHFLAGEMLTEDLCGCGEELGSCNVWSLVWQLTKEWSVLRLPRLRDINHKKEASNQLIMRYNTLIKALTEMGVETIVDSSKSPEFFTKVVLKSSFQEIRVIHVRRHFGGVYNSMKKKIVKPERTEEFMNRHSLWYAFVIWFLSNQRANKMKILNNVQYKRLEYERFCDDIRVRDEMINFLSESNVINLGSLQTYHSVSGNPMRFNQPKLRIRKDDEWRTKLGIPLKVILEILNNLAK